MHKIKRRGGERGREGTNKTKLKSWDPAAAASSEEAQRVQIELEVQGRHDCDGVAAHGAPVLAVVLTLVLRVPLVKLNAAL